MTDNIFDNRQRRKFLEKEAKKLRGIPFRNDGFNYDVVITGKSIKEILNQPHRHFIEKNESILDIKNLYEKSTYLGRLQRKKSDDIFDSYLFETKIAGDKSFIIVKKYEAFPYHFIYTISDQETLEGYLQK